MRLAMALLAAALVLGSVRVADAQNLDWPMYRRDAQNTGYCPVAAAGGTPSIAWQTWTGYYEGYVEVAFGTAGSATCALGPTTFGSDYLTLNAARYGIQRLADVCGNSTTLAIAEDTMNAGALECMTGNGLPLGSGDLVENTRTRIAKVLPGSKGLQMVQFEDGLLTMMTPDTGYAPTAKGYLWSFDKDGTKRLVWETTPEPMCEGPLVTLADVSGKGQLDVVVTTWYRVMVFDGLTGVKKWECRWDNGRNYGYTEVGDLNGDGHPEVVVLGDYMIQMSVLTSDGNSLKLKWSKAIDYNVFQKKVVIHTGVSPVADLNGDGKKELIVSVYNQTGDCRWHVMIYDAFTGKPLADLPDWHVDGVVDLNGDGKSELLLGKTNALAQAVNGPLAIGRFLSGRLTLQAVPTAGRWLTTTLASYPLNKATIAAPRGVTAAVVPCGSGKKAAIAIQGAADLSAQTVYAYGMLSTGAPAKIWRCSLPAGVTVTGRGIYDPGAGAAGSLLLCVSSSLVSPGNVTASGCSVTTDAWARKGRSTSPMPIVATLKQGDLPTTLFETAPNTLQALKPASAGQQPVPIWTSPGRGAAFNWPLTQGVVAADVFGDGNKVILAAGQDPTGMPSLLALAADGSTRYRHVFQRFNGAAPTTNTGGMLYWKVGHYLSPTSLSVLVTLRRSVLHTEETCLLDVVNNKEVWWQSNIGQRGCGGGLFANADLRGTGQDDVIGGFPDIVYGLNGGDGNILSWKAYEANDLGGWTGYEDPIVWKLKQSGVNMIFQASGPNPYDVIGRTLDSNLTMVWHTAYMKGSTVMPAFGDLDGDGLDELGAILTAPTSLHQMFNCFDAASGKLKWQLDMGAGAPTDMLSCPRPGGGAEFIFAVGTKITAVVGNGTKGQILWQLTMPDKVVNMILADADGDGRLELLVTCGSSLFCIKGF